MRAVLALRQMDFKKHAAVIATFHKDYIHPGIFDKRYAAVITNASMIRNHSDYDDFYICSQEETEKLIRDVQDFVDAVGIYLQQEDCAF